MTNHAATWGPGVLMHFGSLNFVLTAGGELARVVEPTLHPRAVEDARDELNDLIDEALEILQLRDRGVQIRGSSSLSPQRDREM